jgi:hypothetical protein
VSIAERCPAGMEPNGTGAVLAQEVGEGPENRGSDFTVYMSSCGLSKWERSQSGRLPLAKGRVEKYRHLVASVGPHHDPRTCQSN